MSGMATRVFMVVRSDYIFLCPWLRHYWVQSENILLRYHKYSIAAIPRSSAFSLEFFSTLLQKIIVNEHESSNQQHPSRTPHHQHTFDKTSLLSDPLPAFNLSRVNLAHVE